MSERGGIDRDRIVAAARAILETRGIDGLSMRALAVALDSKTMTIYHYVSGKPELLTLVLTQVAEEIDWTPPTGAPRHRMVEVVMDMFARLSDIPWIVPILSQGIAVGTPALILADRFLSAALEDGCDEQTALSLWRSASWIAQTELIFRASVARRAPDETSWHQRLNADDLDDIPVVQSLLPRWGQHSADYDLRAAITWLIDGAPRANSPTTPSAD